MCILEESDEDGSCGQDIVDEFGTVLYVAVACHDHGSEFIPTHNDLEKIFSDLV